MNVCMCPGQSRVRGTMNWDLLSGWQPCQQNTKNELQDFGIEKTKQNKNKEKTKTNKQKT